MRGHVVWLCISGWVSCHTHCPGLPLNTTSSPLPSVHTLTPPVVSSPTLSHFSYLQLHLLSPLLTLNRHSLPNPLPLPIPSLWHTLTTLSPFPLQELKRVLVFSLGLGQVSRLHGLLRTSLSPNVSGGRRSMGLHCELVSLDASLCIVTIAAPSAPRSAPPQGPPPGPPPSYSNAVTSPTRNGGLQRHLSAPTRSAWRQQESHQSAWQQDDSPQSARQHEEASQSTWQQEYTAPSTWQQEQSSQSSWQHEYTAPSTWEHEEYDSFDSD